MKNWLKLRLKEWLEVSTLEAKLKLLQSSNKALTQELAQLRTCQDELQHFVTAKIQEHTKVDVAVSPRGRNTAVLTGIYRNKPYVQFYDLSSEDFYDLVERLKLLSKHGLVRNIDAPPEIHRKLKHYGKPF